MADAAGSGAADRESRRDLRGRSAAAYVRAAGRPHLAERLDTVVDTEKTIW